MLAKTLSVGHTGTLPSISRKLLESLMATWRGFDCRLGQGEFTWVLGMGFPKWRLLVR